MTDVYGFGMLLSMKVLLGFFEKMCLKLGFLCIYQIFKLMTKYFQMKRKSTLSVQFTCVICNLTI